MIRWNGGASYKALHRICNYTRNLKDKIKQYKLQLKRQKTFTSETIKMRWTRILQSH